MLRRTTNELQIYNLPEIISSCKIDNIEKKVDIIKIFHEKCFFYFDDFIVNIIGGEDFYIYIKKFEDNIAFQFISKNNELKQVTIMNIEEEIDCQICFNAKGVSKFDSIFYIMEYLVCHLPYLDNRDKFGYAKFIKRDSKVYDKSLFEMKKVLTETIEENFLWTDNDDVSKINMGYGMFLDPDIGNIDSFSVRRNLYENDKVTFFNAAEEFRKIPKFFNNIVHMYEETDNSYGSIIEFKYHDDYRITFYSYAFDGDECLFISCGTFLLHENKSVKMSFTINGFDDIDTDMAHDFSNLEDVDTMVVNSIATSLYCLSLLYKAISNKKSSDATPVAKTNSSKEYHKKSKAKDQGVTLSRSEIIHKKYTLDNLDGISVKIRQHGIREKVERAPVRKHDVCGFWRHYKSGKKVWIAPFERGSGDKVVKNIKIE